MLWTLIRQEWVKNLLELRFLVCAVLCVVLAGVSMLVLHADLVARKSEYYHNQAVYRQEAEAEVSSGYSYLWNQGIRIARPPQDFQVLFLGLEKGADRTAQITPQFLSGFKAEWSANPLLMLFPVADVLFVVGVVLSLLAFFLSYDAVAGERGTLKLVLSYPVPRDTVILAKWLGGYLSLALPFVVALGLSALLIRLSGEVGFTGQDWGAWAVTGLVSLLLLAGMFSLGLLVSVRARQASTAILTLLALWVVLALAVPSAGPYLAEVAAPAPDVGAVEREIAEHIRELNAQFNRQWVSAIPRMSRQEMIQVVKARDQLQVEINRAIEERLRAFERQVQRQVEIARILTRLSPVAAYVYAATDLGETGVRHEQRLLDQLRLYQQQFRRYLDEKLGEEGELVNRAYGSLIVSERDENYTTADLPVFIYGAEALSERVAARSTDLLVLVVFAVLFFLLAVVSFLRTDVA